MNSVEPSADDFRQAFRQTLGGVSVITVAHQGQRSGLTITSLVSLSPSSQELLLSVNPTSSSFPLLQSARQFGVNVLNLNQVAVAQRFSGVGGCKAEARYADALWSCYDGVWLLDDALVAMRCQVNDILHRGDHALVIGQIQQLHSVMPACDEPLGYGQAQYGRFIPSR
ncbi:flavin reductase family protein [Limnohabitans sp.]|uniref:flavin reductase family protein n=1 Tax=Limnohabitans sp. TaxID=1907725 RepID=UPI00286F14CB|nr:flavin reductase family protein [Limnohabitans sp.]